jgi:hypothetical protein
VVVEVVVLVDMLIAVPITAMAEKPPLTTPPTTPPDVPMLDAPAPAAPPGVSGPPLAAVPGCPKGPFGPPAPFAPAPIIKVSVAVLLPLPQQNNAGGYRRRTRCFGGSRDRLRVRPVRQDKHDACNRDFCEKRQVSSTSSSPQD